MIATSRFTTKMGHTMAIASTIIMGTMEMIRITGKAGMGTITTPCCNHF